MIIPFKNRVIDYSKPVMVYRCLNRAGVWYSIKQNGFVKAHCDHLVMSDVFMSVNEKGRQRALRDRERNVHAWILGTIIPNDSTTRYYRKAFYNPFKNETFVDDSGEALRRVAGASVGPCGVFFSK